MKIYRFILTIIAASAVMSSCSADTPFEETAARIFSVATYNVDGTQLSDHLPVEAGSPSLAGRWTLKET